MGKIYKNSILYGGGGSGGAGGHTIQDTDGTDMPAEDNLQFVGLDVQDDSTNDATTVESFGLNSDSLDDVVDGSIGNEIINNGMTYSTSEQIVGKWIDGKPLYQKTVIGTYNADAFADLGLSPAFAQAVVVTAHKSGYPWQVLGRYTVLSNLWIRENGQVVCDASSSEMTGATIYATIQYTKTTD